MIITGHAPHQAENVTKCIKAVASNEIKEVAPKHRGELMNIAMKAMASKPEDRYPDVQSFQAAIRQYRSHAESISIATLADKDFKDAVTNKDYTDFSRAAFGYEQAIQLWEGNETARQGLRSAKLEHAKVAHENEDFDLGLSLLDDEDPEHQPLIEELHQGIWQRELRESRIARLKTLAAAMLAFILVGAAVAIYLINDQRSKAISERKIAQTQTKLAEQKTREVEREKENVEREKENVERQKKIAEEKTEEANRNLKIANEERKRANTNAMVATRNEKRAEALAKTADENARQAQENAVKAFRQEEIAKDKAELATRAQNKAEYEVYLSQIGLAKARIERNEFDDARRILNELRNIRGPDRLGWEWRWLWRQANQADSANQIEEPLDDLSLSESGRIGIAVLENGSLQRLVLAPNGTVTGSRNISPPLRFPVSAAAVSADGTVIAIGSRSGELELWDSNLSQRFGRLVGHEQQITDLAFDGNQTLVSGSLDRTARVWDVATGRQLADCWHIAPVRGIAINRLGDPSELTVATAVADAASGRAVIWRVSKSSKQTAQRVGEFSRHTKPISAIALSHDGTLAASGDESGNVYLWRPSQAEKTNYESSINQAIRAVNGKSSTSTRPSKATSTPVARLIDKNITRNSALLVSTGATASRLSRAHSDVVQTLGFSKDGKRLLTTAHDYTIKLWDLPNRSLSKTLRGHGGWVTAAVFSPSNRNRVLSVSKDGSIRTWNTKTYVDDSVLIQQFDRPKASGISSTRQSRPHIDEIWSARFDPAGQRIVSASRDHTARVLQIDRKTLSFKEVTRLKDESVDRAGRLVEGTEFRAMSVAVDRGHGHIFVGSADSTIRIWDLVLGTEIGQLIGTGLNNSIALSKNGRLLLTGSSSRDAKAMLWGIDPTNPTNPKLLYRLKGHDQVVTAFAISPNGRTLFTGDRAGVGWLWDTESGSKIGAAIEDARGYRINAAAFSPDGKSVLIAADDQQLTLLDVATRRRIKRLSHDGFVTQVSTSHQGTHALTVSERISDKSFVAKAILWDLNSGRGRTLDRVESAVNDDRASKRAERTRITSAQFGGTRDSIVVSRSATKSTPSQVRLWSLASVLSDSSSPKSLEMPTRLGTAQVAMPLTQNHMLTLNADAAFLWDLESMTHEKSYRAHASLTQASFSIRRPIHCDGQSFGKNLERANGPGRRQT